MKKYQRKTEYKTCVYYTILLANIAAVFISILKGDPPSEYFKEERLMTYLSGINLLILSGISFCSLFVVCWRYKNVIDKKQIVFWVICALGFVYLSADEMFRFHERMDFWLHDVLGIEETSLTDRIDDLIVLVYGLAGFALFFLFYKNCLDNKIEKQWLFIGAILFLIMVFLDFVSNDSFLYQYITDNRGLDKNLNIILGVAEDTAKDLAEAAFIISFLESFQLVLSRRK